MKAVESAEAQRKIRPILLAERKTRRPVGEPHARLQNERWSAVESAEAKRKVRPILLRGILCAILGARPKIEVRTRHATGALHVQEQVFGHVLYVARVAEPRAPMGRADAGKRRRASVPL